VIHGTVLSASKYKSFNYIKIYRENTESITEQLFYQKELAEGLCEI
jgi:tRNA A37 threonylcarbamoyladenosine modification protein TsaB